MRMQLPQLSFNLASINRRETIVGILLFVAGLLIGWWGIGWWLLPVEYYDTFPQELRRDYKETYIAMAVDSYHVNQDAALAKERLAGFEPGEVKAILTGLIAKRESEGDLPAAQRVRNLAQALGIALATETPGPGETPGAGATPTPVPSGGQVPSFFSTLLTAVLLFVVIFLVVGGSALFISRWQASHKREGGPKAPPSREASAALERVVTWAPAAEYALGRFSTTYKLGDDGYDTSFNIETQAGEFYGACGAGFSEVLARNPDRITAFEVWLFDRSDPQNVQTFTKVIMSEHAYKTPALREKLRGRGEPILVEPGLEISISGVGMELSAKVVEFTYGTAPGLPPNATFDLLSMELVPRLKSG
ncbi:MAG: hypothetical protein HYX86_02040 [Chloroflexi bacterium]|nr:hypothetical protein [Chloroflexota bacterium]